jgi:hypothetical protein
MFWNKNKIKKEMIPHIIPTSKVSLKMSCLHSCNGDIEKAEKLYQYLTEGIEELPTYDPVPPSTMQQAKEMLNSGFSWAKENQDTIVNIISFFKDTFGKGGGTTPTNAIPPINQ